jgi:hypothetical protein
MVFSRYLAFTLLRTNKVNIFYIFTTLGFYHMVPVLKAAYEYLLPTSRHNNIDLSCVLLPSGHGRRLSWYMQYFRQNHFYLFLTTSRFMTFEAYETFPFYL